MLPAPSLDRNPVLWGEWHRSRPSLWMSIPVGLTIGTTTVGCLVGAITLCAKGQTRRGKHQRLRGALVRLSSGRLRFAVVLRRGADGARRGATPGQPGCPHGAPLLRRTIVMGKWMGAFRRVPWLALGPGLALLAIATGQRPGPAFPADEVSIFERLYGVGLFVATILITERPSPAPVCRRPPDAAAARALRPAPPSSCSSPSAALLPLQRDRHANGAPRTRRSPESLHGDGGVCQRPRSSNFTCPELHVGVMLWDLLVAVVAIVLRN